MRFLRLMSLGALFSSFLFAFTVFEKNETSVSKASIKSEEPSSIADVQLFALPNASGLSNPVFVTNARVDDRLFILEKPGRIRIYKNGALLPTPFLDISSLVQSTGSEQGLLGLAFHPQYPSTPFFFVNYTSRARSNPSIPDGATVVARYTVSANPDVANTAETILLIIPQPFTNHNGGMLAFGPDNFLYIGMGDGGSAGDPGNRAQNINELLGKMLRIDVDQNVNIPPFYGIPPTNPFAGPTPGADEIFMLGLRNPWRFSFDRMLGQLFIADVGQDTWEEVDSVNPSTSSGANFGWRIREGNNCFNPPSGCTSPSNYVGPVAVYQHLSGRCSITGGYVYRGAAIPSLAGKYLYADFCTGEIFTLTGTTQALLLDSPHSISSFGEDRLGELYLCAYTSGQIYKLIETPTAATVTISGRVTDASGRGLYKVWVKLSGGNMSEPRYVLTNPFGYYRFVDVETGTDYIVSASSKNRVFTPSEYLLTLTNAVEDLNFVANTP